MPPPRRRRAATRRAPVRSPIAAAGRSARRAPGCGFELPVGLFVAESPAWHDPKGVSEMFQERSRSHPRPQDPLCYLRRCRWVAPGASASDHDALTEPSEGESEAVFAPPLSLGAVGCPRSRAYARMTSWTSGWRTTSISLKLANAMPSMLLKI